MASCCTGKVYMSWHYPLRFRADDLSFCVWFVGNRRHSDARVFLRVPYDVLGEQPERSQRVYANPGKNYGFGP